MFTSCTQRGGFHETQESDPGAHRPHCNPHSRRQRTRILFKSVPTSKCNSRRTIDSLLHPGSAQCSCSLSRISGAQYGPAKNTPKYSENPRCVPHHSPTAAQRHWSSNSDSIRPFLLVRFLNYMPSPAHQYQSFPKLDPYHPAISV